VSQRRKEEKREKKTYPIIGKNAIPQVIRSQVTSKEQEW
jgi:hypothetical protein